MCIKEHLMLLAYITEVKYLVLSMQLALVPRMYMILNQQLPTQAIADTQCEKKIYPVMVMTTIRNSRNPIPFHG